jgi:hypothetical protein
LLYVISIVSLCSIDSLRGIEGRAEANVRIILIGTLVLDVVLIIHILDILLGVVLGFLAINEVHSLRLGELVDLSTCETDEELLGELVGDWLACGSDIVNIGTRKNELVMLWWRGRYWSLDLPSLR